MSRRNPQSIPGIYAITNAVSGTVYIGQAVNIRKRWEVHRCTLEKGKHRNNYLQRAWIKYGPHSFQFSVLEDMSAVPMPELTARLNEAEIAALLRFPNSYNLMEAGHSGTIASAATRRLLSRIRTAMWANPETRALRIAAIRERAADPEHQKRRGAGISAYRNTADAKAAVSAHMLQLWANREHRAAQSAKRLARWQDPAYRARQTASREATWNDPEVRARRVTALKAAWVRRRAKTQLSPKAD